MCVVYICVVPEIKDLLRTQDGEIAQAEALVDNLSEQLSRAKRALTELLIEKRSLKSVARRYGLDIPPTPDGTPASDWTKMSRTDAVERLLGEVPTALWHLTEVETALRARVVGLETRFLSSARRSSISSGRVGLLGRSATASGDTLQRTTALASIWERARAIMMDSNCRGPPTPRVLRTITSLPRRSIA